MSKILLNIILLLIFCHFCYCLSLCQPENEYACKNGTCIPNEWMCDNVPDCLNGEEENDCHYLHVCAANEFMCRSGECLPKSVKCDGHFDCTDHSDEHGCTKVPLSSSSSLAPALIDHLSSSSKCHPENEYACKDGTCIPNEWMCDNVHDCSNGEDEANCHYLHECAANQFMCRSGECLPKSVKCDGHTDRSDERGCELIFPANDNDDNYVTFLVYMLYVALALILIISCCIILNYFMFKPRQCYQIENNVQMVVLEDNKRCTI